MDERDSLGLKTDFLRMALIDFLPQKGGEGACLRLIHRFTVNMLYESVIQSDIL